MPNRRAIFQAPRKLLGAGFLGGRLFLLGHRFLGSLLLGSALYSHEFPPFLSEIFILKKTPTEIFYPDRVSSPPSHSRRIYLMNALHYQLMMNYNSLFLNVRHHPIACQDKTIHLKNFFHSVPSHIFQGSESDITISKIFALLEFFSRFSKKTKFAFCHNAKNASLSRHQ